MQPCSITDSLSLENLLRLDNLPEGKGNLPSQEVEVVGRGGAVGHDHVDVRQLLHGKLRLLRGEILWVIRGHLQEALWLSAAVLRAHALHTMREEHHQARLPHPLGLARADELK